jgi:hypothetical protein
MVGQKSATRERDYMAVLTAKARKALPTSTFALPGRRYPLPDRSHAQNALARVSQHGTPAEKAKVRAAVKRKYPGMGKSNPGNPAMPKTPAMMPKKPMMGQTGKLSAMMGK